MICQWQTLLGILPPWIKSDVDKQGREGLEELRLRLDAKPLLCFAAHQQELSRKITQDDLQYIINIASGYSPWATASIAKGYLTIPGGHRIGIVGDAILKNGIVTGIRQISSLCIRVSRDFSGISKNAPIRGSVLVIGCPGSGKTTLLRDMIRRRSDAGPGSICVIDERCELFPVAQSGMCYYPGKNTDVISGCPKKEGLEMAVRSMGPQTVAVDEITAEADCKALLHAGWCGVDILATAHAASQNELFARSVYKPLLDMKLFQSLVILNRDKTYNTERMA